MKSTTKRLLVAILSIAMVFTLLPSTVFAAGKPIITQQPTSVTAGEDKTVSFTVVAEDATSYRWQVKTSETASWKNSSYNTSTQPTLSIKALASRDGYQYRCKVTNDAGSVYTDAVALSVVSKPVITQHPQDVRTFRNATARFTVQAEGAESYLWQIKTPVSSKWVTSGYETSRSATLEVPVTSNRDGYQYRCKVTNAAGSVYTDEVTLSVIPKPVVEKVQDKAVSAKIGTKAVITVNATGEGTLTYRWQTKTSDEGKWIYTKFAGSDTASVQIPVTAARDGYLYRCIVSNESGNAYSDEYGLFAYGILSQPKSTKAYINQDATFEVEAIGVDYQWQIKTSADGEWKNASSTFAGSKGAILHIPATKGRDGYQFRCKLTRYGKFVEYTKAVTLDVLPYKVLEWKLYPTGVRYNVGETIVIPAEVEGGKAPYTFTWKQTYYDDSSVKTTTVKSNDGTGSFKKVCEEKDYRSGIELVVTDSSGQQIDCPGPIYVGTYTPISKKDISTADVSIDYDSLPSAELSVGMRRMEVRLDSYGSGKIHYEWQYVPATVAKSKITEDDWKLMPGESQGLTGNGPFLGTNTNTLYIKKCSALKSFLGTNGVWFRLKVTDTERGVVLIARECSKMYLK